MTAHRYRKKPVTITAVQWTGDNAAEISEWTIGRFHEVDPEDRTEDPEITAAVLDVLHSTWIGVKTGQWVLRGVQGEFYPCDDEVFAATYEPVEGT